MIEIELKDRAGNVRAVTQVDDEYAHLTMYKWALHNGYATSSQKGLLHRSIMNVTDPRQWIDHIDRDKLNNQKSNLRLATFRQNALNKRKAEGGSSQYRGVSRKNGARQFMVRVVHDGKTIYLGEYDSELDAARQYDYYILQHSLDNPINGVDIPIDMKPFQKMIRSQQGNRLPSGSWRVVVIVDGQMVSKVVRTHGEAMLMSSQLKAKAARIEYMQRLDAYSIDEATTTLRLSCGTQVLVDTNDVQQMANYHWSLDNHGYVRTGVAGGYKLLHRFLMQPDERDIVDHINGVRTDNRRSNLRNTTSAVNNHNRSLKNKGVNRTRNGKFTALIRHSKKAIYCGIFDTFEEALAARNAKAIELYGDHARLQ